MTGERLAVRLAADANVLLAAVIGGRAGLVLSHPQVAEVFTTQRNREEVEEYALLLAEKRKLRPDLLLLAVATLPVRIVEEEEYSHKLSEARRLIGKRDPDDADLLALALHFDIPVWSNDRHFENLPVELFTTEAVLRRLKMIP